MCSSDLNIKITNKNLLAVKTFFVELNEIITKLTKKAKGRLKPQHLSGEKLYLNIEKKRILLLYQIYMKLNIFNERKKKNIDYIYIKNMDVINSNKFCDEIKIYEIKQYIKCININIRFGIIILISIFIGIKYNEDLLVNANIYAQIAGICTDDLLNLEYNMCVALEFGFYVKEDLFQQYFIYFSKYSP